MSKQWIPGEEITAKKLNDTGFGWKVVAQDTPDMTVRINPGVAVVDGSTVKYAGGNSPSMTAPVSNPRIDLVHVSSAGVIGVTTGVEGASPSAPAYPADKTVLAEIYHRVGATTIRDVDTSGQSYIYRDSRSLGAPVTLINATAGTADAGKGVKTDADGYIDKSFFNVSFGDGSDGDVTISSPTTLTRDMYYNNLVVNDTLDTAGFRIYVKLQISGSGTIRHNGGNGGNGTNDNRTPAGTAGTIASTGFFTSGNGGDGGLGGTSGNDGTSGGTGEGTIYNALGGRGGNTYRGGGRNDTSNNAATSGTLVAPYMQFGMLKFLTVSGTDLNIPPASRTATVGSRRDSETKSYVSGTDSQNYQSHEHDYFPALVPIRGGNGGAGGGGGHGYTASGSSIGASAGGGGAGGGVVFICARTWAGTFTIEAKGGNGGNGGNKTTTHGGGGSGGGGGGGGVIIVIYKIKTWSGTSNVSGGTGGSPGTQVGGGIQPSAGDNGSAGSFKQIDIGNLI